MLQPRLVSVEPLANMELRLEYETGEAKLFGVAPYASGSWYGELNCTTTASHNNHRRRLVLRLSYVR